MRERGDVLKSVALIREFNQCCEFPLSDLCSGLRYPGKKAFIVLKTIVKPVVITMEADNDGSRLPVPSDEDFFRFGFPDDGANVVLCFSYSMSFHSELEYTQTSRPCQSRGKCDWCYSSCVGQGQEVGMPLTAIADS